MKAIASSTAALVIASKQGDENALGDLMERYRGYLLMLAHRFLSQSLRRRVVPADLVERTILQARRDLEAFRGETPAEFAGWLRGMLKHHLAAALAHHAMTQRRSTRCEEHASESDSEAVSEGIPWAAFSTGAEVGPSGCGIRRDPVIDWMDVLRTLPEPQAEAMRLRFVESLPLAEIVDRMGVSDTAVAGLLKRGLLGFPRELDTCGSPWLRS